MIRIENAGKTFPRERGRPSFEALRGVSFDVADGEFVSIIGPSGCGKTTLLRLIHGLEPLSTGAVYSGDKRIDGPSSSSAMIFQQFNLFPWLTVRRNVAFGLEVAKRPPAECMERADHFVKLVGLERFADHYPHELSGGMQQRVGIARALAIFFSVRIMVMGARPGRILEEVRVDLPHPREADAVRASRQFATLREHLWSQLSGAASQGAAA